MIDQFIPKGGMCATCTNKYMDCSRLYFEGMPVIEEWVDPHMEDTVFKVVRCTNWYRGKPVPANAAINIDRLEINSSLYSKITGTITLD